VNDDYNLAELKIALDATDPRHILPPALPPHLKVLDVGCGAGQSLIGAYPDRLSFGIDIDLDALKTGKSISDRICLVNGAAEKLPFKSREFGFVFARVALPYTNIPISLREIHRVLNERGRIWLVLHPFALPWKQVKTTNYKGKIWFAYIVLNSVALHLFQRQFSFLGKYESFQTEKGIRRALTRSGFEDVQITRGRHFVVTARAKY
jgi:ubiquinone/menaquinone biosynthesis C-methylase UbiE